MGEGTRNMCKNETQQQPKVSPLHSKNIYFSRKQYSPIDQTRRINDIPKV